MGCKLVADGRIHCRGMVMQLVIMLLRRYVGFVLASWAVSF